MRAIPSKTRLAIILLLIPLIFAARALGEIREPAQKSSMRTITDQLGRKVSVPRDVRRIVIFALPLPLVLYAVDGTGKRIIGMNPKARNALKKNLLGIMAPELKETASSFVEGNTMFNVNIEALLNLKPEVVLQWARMEDDLKLIEKMGIPVIALSVRNYDDVTDWIRIAGELLGKQEKADALIAYHNETVEFISSRTKGLTRDQKPRVFFLTRFSAGNISTVGRHPYYDFAVELTGAVNVAEGMPGGGGKNINMEQIMIWNPDIIYLGNINNLEPEDFYENRMPHDWSRINAVKHHRVYKIPDAGFWWYPPSLESPLYFRWLAQLHHPDLFKDYSMIHVLKDFYSTFFNYNLSDDKAARILRTEEQETRNRQQD